MRGGIVSEELRTNSEVTKGGLAIQVPAKTGTGTRKSIHCEVVW